MQRVSWTSEWGEGGNSGIFDIFPGGFKICISDEQNKVDLNVAAIEGRSAVPIFTTRKRDCGKVMFSQVSVCPRGAVVPPPSTVPHPGALPKGPYPPPGL